MALRLQSRSGSVAQVATAVAGDTKAKAECSDRDFLVGVDPLLLGSAWRFVNGVRNLSDPEGVLKAQFNETGVTSTKTSKALTLRAGVLNLQIAALQLETRRNLHAAMAVNNLASGALAWYNHSEHGLDSQEAAIRVGVALALGGLAAAQAIKEHGDLAE